MCHGIILYVNVITIMYVTIDCGVSESVHGGEVVDCINTTDNRFIFQLMSTVRFPGEKCMTHRWLCALKNL